MEEFKSHKIDATVEKVERPIRTIARQAMREKLFKLNGEQDFQRYIYPYLLEIADCELPPIAVAGVITMAIEHHTLGDRTQPSSGLLKMFAPHFVDAMVDDPAQREQIKQKLLRRT